MAVEIKTENELFNEITQDYKDIDNNWDVSPSSFDGFLIAALSESFANLYELVQKAYISKDPNSAEEMQLRDIAYISGLIQGENEKDSNFRLRRNKSVALPSNNQLDSLRAAVANIEDVTHTKVFENFDNTTDSKGLPAHSIALLVQGGDNNKIALQYYLKKNPGTKMHAINDPITITVTSPKYKDTTLDVLFSRPNIIEAKVDIKIKKVDTLPSDISQQIKKSIIDYANGDFINVNGYFDQSGFDIGESVPISKLYTPINAVVGPYTSVSELKLNDNTTNLEILFNQLVDFKEDNITVIIDD